jgi:hypothetical protein
MTPTRRGFLLGSAALFSEPALARLPHGAATPAVGGNTLSVATYPEQALTSGVNGVARATQIVMGWTGVAPTGVAAVWSGGGGSATITDFTVDGPFISFYASNPTSATGTLNLAITGTGPNIASASAIGIVVTAAVSDIATGVTGPNNVMLGQQPFGGSFPIASYATRGLIGPVQYSLTNITAGAQFTISVIGVVSTGGLFTGLGTTLTYTVNATDGITSLTPLVVTVQNPVSGTIIGVNNGNIALDSATPDPFWSGYFGFSVAIISTLNLWGGATTATLSDPSGYFLLGSPNTGQYNILLRASDKTNYGTYNLTITPAGGSAFVYPIAIMHEAAPTISWASVGPLTSATPPTNGYGSNQIGFLGASGDSGIKTMTLISNPSGALNIYSYDPFFSRMGFAFLQNSISAGTLAGTCQIITNNGVTANMILTLPVATGITYASSNISTTPVTGLTNYSFPTAISLPGAPATADTTFTNGQITGTALTFTSFTGVTPTKGMMIFGFYPLAGTTITEVINSTTCTVNYSQTTPGPFTLTGNLQTVVSTGTVTGFTPNYDLTVIDGVDDNFQVSLWAPLTPEPSPPLTYLPRYSILGSGGTFSIVAWNGSATVDPTTREPADSTDTIALTLTDGNGNYCTQTFTNTVSWHTYTGAALTVGPPGSGATWTSTDDMGNALVATPATYAGATITALRGTDSSWHWDGYGASSYYGYLKCPIYFKRDESTQASFTGTITSVTGTGVSTTGTLTVSGGTGTIVAYDFILIAGTAAGIIPVSGSGTTWTVSGPGVATMSSIAMTTQIPQVWADFNGAAPAGSFNGGFACGGGFDIIWKGFEGFNCSNGSQNAGAFYKFNQQVGAVTLVYCYAHDSNMGYEGGDVSTQVNIYDSLFAGCGPGGSGGSHNVYVDPCGRLRFLRNRSHDAWGHELKLRAYWAQVMDNFIVEGCNWLGEDSPLQHCQGGIYDISGNVIMKGCDDNASQNGNIIETYNECAPGAAEPAWAINTLLIDSNTIINTIVPGQAPPREPALGVTQVNGNYDPVRNIPYGYTITNNNFWNLPEAQWSGGTFGGTPPAFGSGNTGVATFPGTNLDLINPLTGAPPQRLPLRHNVIASSPGPSNTVTPYATVLKLPSGASAGTAVALIGAYDGAEVQMNPSVMTASGTQFTVAATSADTGTIQNVGTLADGVYYTEITATGTGTPNLPNPQFFPIIVGAGTVPPS